MAGAVLLPAATITIVPHAVPLGLIEYDLTIDDAERIAGAAEAALPPCRPPASCIRSRFPPRGASRSSTGRSRRRRCRRAVRGSREQAFATQADVEVARGAPTGQGTIRAGETSVEVAAAAVGPAANVPAGAINTIVVASLDARLRGFPENTQSTVLNAAPTAGGVDTTGPEITQADVDPAVAAITEEVTAEVADALEPTRGTVLPTRSIPPPRQQSRDSRASSAPGTSRKSSLNGSLYDRRWTPRDEVVAAAEEQLAADASALPTDHELLPAATEVTIREARVDGNALVVTGRVTGASAAVADPERILGLIRGQSASDANAALEAIGPADVDLWPGWVGTVPELDWRIDLRHWVGGRRGRGRAEWSAPP